MTLAIGPATAAGRRPRLAPPQDAPEPAAQPACDGAEMHYIMHIKEGSTVRPMETHAAD